MLAKGLVAALEVAIVQSWNLPFPPESEQICQLVYPLERYHEVFPILMFLTLKSFHSRRLWCLGALPNIIFGSARA